MIATLLRRVVHAVLIVLLMAPAMPAGAQRERRDTHVKREAQVREEHKRNREQREVREREARERRDRQGRDKHARERQQHETRERGGSREERSKRDRRERPRDPAAEQRAQRDGRGQYNVPRDANTMARTVRDHRGQAPRGHVGGEVFENREGKLPQGGSYRSYDVHPYTKGQRRDAERVVRDGRSGKAWYTRDHYRSFVEIRQ